MKLIKSVLTAFLMFFIMSCGPLLERETVAYGLITDEDGEPVDSILVILARSLAISDRETLGKTYSNKLGFYEVIADVPNKWWSAHLNIPFWPEENKKYQDLYKSYEFSKNQKSAGGSGLLSIGLKTRCDFTLISK
jgi:hypothetical protein